MENYKLWMLNSIAFMIITLIGFWAFITLNKSHWLVLIPALIGVISVTMWVIRENQFKRAKARTIV